MLGLSHICGMGVTHTPAPGAAGKGSGLQMESPYLARGERFIAVSAGCSLNNLTPVERLLGEILSPSTHNSLLPVLTPPWQGFLFIR